MLRSYSRVKILAYSICSFVHIARFWMQWRLWHVIAKAFSDVGDAGNLGFKFEVVRKTFLVPVLRLWIAVHDIRCHTDCMCGESLEIMIDKRDEQRKKRITIVLNKERWCKHSCLVTSKAWTHHVKMMWIFEHERSCDSIGTNILRLCDPKPWWLILIQKPASTRSIKVSLHSLSRLW